MSEFLNRVKILMEENDLGYSGMADITGLSKSCFGDWVRNERYPNSYNLIILAKAFGVSADWLLGLSDERETMQALMIDVPETGANIKRLMELKDVTPKMIQHRLGLTSPQAIYKWVWGKCLPNIDNLVVLADTLGVTIDEILVLKKG